MSNRKINEDNDVEYRIVVDEDGTVNHFPILSDEEREERHQNFLRIADRIIEKYIILFSAAYNQAELLFFLNCIIWK
jgi:hypothetical protein